MRRISEVNTIPDIRERNDRPKDEQPKHQVTSTVQRQMVQKFVKELSDSAKQPDRSDSAERIATEQVETAARELSTKLFNCRVVQSSILPAEDQKILLRACSRSGPTSRAMRRNYRENEQTRRVPGQMQRRRRAHRYPHHRSRPAAPMFSKPQKRLRQRRRSRRSSRSIPQ